MFFFSGATFFTSRRVEESNRTKYMGVHDAHPKNSRSVAIDKDDKDDNYDKDDNQRMQGDDDRMQEKDEHGNLRLDDHERLDNFVRSIRKPLYKPLTIDPEGNEMPYDVNNCPEVPPANYPIEWTLLELLNNWIPDDTTFPSLAERPIIYQGLCRFDYRTEYHKATTYRKAELPFILRDDPEILHVVERWADPDYLPSVLGKNTPYLTELSESNHLMYFKSPHGKKKKKYVPPISKVKMTYDQWVEKASQPDQEMGPGKPHWYFRISAKDALEEDLMFQELPFFKSKENFYIVDTNDTRGINCRFGMKGNIAEAHYDSSRNFVALFGGERRYILAHPKNCPNLALYPHNHPSGRHTALDWSAPDLEAYPSFANAKANEVVLQAGDVLYLPTSWFHHIISLDMNWQCNARSGMTDHYTREIQTCNLR